jgi:hypothetical protein
MPLFIFGLVYQKINLFVDSLDLTPDCFQRGVQLVPGLPYEIFSLDELCTEGLYLFLKLFLIEGHESSHHF